MRNALASFAWPFFLAAQIVAQSYTCASPRGVSWSATSCGYIFSTSSSLYAAASNQYACYGTGPENVYSMTIPDGSMQTLTVSSSGVAFSGVVYLRYADSCSYSSYLACDSDFFTDPTYNPALKYQYASANTQYVLIFDSTDFPSSGGYSYSFSLLLTPYGVCCNPLIFAASGASGNFAISGSTTSNDYGTRTSCDSSTAAMRQAVYALYLPQPYYYYLKVTVSSGALSPVFVVRDAACSYELSCGVGSLSASLLGGATRALAITSRSTGYDGYYTGTVTLFYDKSCDVPDNLGSTLSWPVRFSGQTTSYSATLSPTCAASWYGATPDRVHVFSVPSSSQLTFTVVMQNTATVVAIYVRRSNQCSQAIDVACNVGTGRGTLVTSVSPGTYYVVVDAFNDAYTLSGSANTSIPTWCGSELPFNRPSNHTFALNATFQGATDGLIGACSPWTANTSEIVAFVEVPFAGVFLLNATFFDDVDEWIHARASTFVNSTSNQTALAPWVLNLLATPVSMYVRTIGACTKPNSDLACRSGTVGGGVWVEGFFRAPGRYAVIVDGVPSTHSNITSVFVRGSLRSSTASTSLSATWSASNQTTRTASLSGSASSERTSSSTPQWTASSTVSASGSKSRSLSSSFSDTLSMTVSLSSSLSVAVTSTPTKSRPRTKTRSRSVSTTSSATSTVSLSFNHTFSLNESLSASSSRSSTSTKNASWSHSDSATHTRTGSPTRSRSGSRPSLSFSPRLTLSLTPSESRSPSRSRSSSYTATELPPVPTFYDRVVANSLQASAMFLYVASALAMGNSMVSVASSRAYGLITLATCKNNRYADYARLAPQVSMPLFVHPTGIAIVEAGQLVQYHAGLVAVNLAVALGLFLLHGFAVVAHRLVTACHPRRRHSATSEASPWSRSAMAMRYPTFFVGFQSGLLLVSIPSAVECLTRGTREGGVIGFCAVTVLGIGVLFATRYTLAILPRSLSCVKWTSDRALQEVDCRTSWLHPATRWETNTPGATGWTCAQVRACFGGIFEVFGEPTRWWFTPEVASSALTGLAAGLIDIIPCSAASLCGIAPIFLYSCLLLRKRPHRRRIEVILAVAHSFAASAAAVCCFLGAWNTNDKASAACAALAIVSLAPTTAGAALTVATSWRRRRGLSRLHIAELSHRKEQRQIEALTEELREVDAHMAELDLDLLGLLPDDEGL